MNVIQLQLTERFQQWVDSYRYRFGGEFADGRPGGWESRYWETHAAAAQAIPDAKLAVNIGKYKYVELITSTKRNGRWKFLSRERIA